MYIENFKRKNESPETNRPEERIESFYLEKPEDLEEIEAPEEELIAEHSADVLAHWRAREFEQPQRSRRWHLFAALFLVLIISFAVYIDAMVMAIVFILIGIVGYIYMGKESRVLDFIITYDGILAGKDFYRFKNLESFWIFYEEDLKVISIHTDGYLTPHVHIPLSDQDPVEIRDILIKYLPEVEQEWTIFDRLEKLIKI